MSTTFSEKYDQMQLANLSMHEVNFHQHNSDMPTCPGRAQQGALRRWWMGSRTSKMRWN